MKVNVNELRNLIPTLKAGDKIELSGTIYTGRDAAHKKFTELIEKGEKPTEAAKLAAAETGFRKKEIYTELLK